MPMMNSARLIDLVYARDPLWNPKSNFYHNREMKHLLWTEIAAELGVSRETVRTKWSCLRDSFRRELKKRQDGGFISKAQWPFFNRMLFLTSAMSAKDYSADQEFYNDTGETFEMIANPEVLMSSGGTTCDAGNSNMEVPSTSEQINFTEVRIKEEPTTSTQAATTTYRPPPMISIIPDMDVRPIYAPPSLPFRPETQARNVRPDYSKERRKLKKIRKKLKKEKERDEDYHFALSLVSSMKKVPVENKIKMRMMVMDTISSFACNLPDNPDQSTCDNSTSLIDAESYTETENPADEPLTMADTSSMYAEMHHDGD
ncbi:hypothetical protein GE061_012364 [Apolygus lucorum]|uniref:MADF domain-containing protein n=1 Tax=Apolygus lucorum TaxID=248454 RepID=A0A8S9XUD1_APOLU|nr:hypothetical protein GE061_012364 [Apolygus lucorum]